MPRRYTRGYTRRYYGRRKKWAPVFLQTQGVIAGDSQFATQDLAVNSAVQGTAAPISTVIKVKNFKVNVDVYSTGGSSGTSPSCLFAIMYIPQGYTPTLNTFTDHPEWIMAWRTIDLQTTNTVQVSSRLARNLNSGDKVVFAFSRANTITAQTVIQLYTSFYTCNN